MSSSIPSRPQSCQKAIPVGCLILPIAPKIPYPESLAGFTALPTFNAARLILGKPGLVILGIALFCAVLSGIIGFYMATSRLLYSMSKDHVLPGWFGRLHPRYKTPMNASCSS